MPRARKTKESDKKPRHGGSLTNMGLFGVSAYFLLKYGSIWRHMESWAIVRELSWAQPTDPHAPYIPEDQQTTVWDYNYSTTNRGKYEKGKWTSQRNTSHMPSLFMDRLNQYLPECPPIQEYKIDGNYTPCDNATRLFPKDVERIERHVLKFNIPRKIVIVLNEDAPYISTQMWRWNLIIDALNQTTGTRRMCPNCHIRYPKHSFIPPNLTVEPAHVRIYQGCNDYIHTGRLHSGQGRDFPGQLLVGDCGESQFGTGRGFWEEGINKFDYQMSFVDDGSPFVRTYAFLHLSPDRVYHHSGLKPLYNVTNFVEQLLSLPVPSFPRHVNNTQVRERLALLNLSTAALEQASSKFDATFIHSNCGMIRGDLMRKIFYWGTNLTVAFYGGCWHNAETSEIMGGGWHSADHPEWSMHNNSEGHRDSSKTVIASHHKFTFALENTLSPYYFTEKRWQVLLAASVPIVWDNHNSIQFLPDPDAALIVPSRVAHFKDVAKEAAHKIHYYAQPEQEQEYLDKFFAWKHRGLRPDFVRKLFLSSDFLLCRICEYAAHHHFYDEDE